MSSVYLNDILLKIERLHPGASVRLDQINELPRSTGSWIVSLLLEYACHCQNSGAITSARTLLCTLPPAWLAGVLPSSIDEIVNLNDEWEYRRLIELLQEVKSEFLAFYLDHGVASTNPEISEAAREMKEQ